MRNTALAQALLLLATVSSCGSSARTAGTSDPGNDAASMLPRANDAMPDVSSRDATVSLDAETGDAQPRDLGIDVARDGGMADAPQPSLDADIADVGPSDSPRPDVDAGAPESGAGDSRPSGLDAASPDTGSGGGPDAAGDAPAHVPAPAKGYVEMKLYNGDPPNLRANAPAEQVSGNGSISNVSVPTLRRYPVDESKSAGVAFIVFPGGAYTGLDFETHATALAQRLGPLGIAVFGLKYRVGGGSSNPERDALLDANRAMRLVRSHAGEWGLAENRIGIISYSAGSDLDMRLLAGGSDLGKPAATDPVERKSSRPDFVASMCTWAHGSSTSPYKFTADTPPVYLCHAQDDTLAPIAVANQIDQQLRALGVLEHLEVYPTGGHSAFHVGDANAPGRNWPDKYLSWLRSNNLIP